MVATLVHFWDFCPKTQIKGQLHAQKFIKFWESKFQNFGTCAYFEAGPVELSVDGNLKNMKRSMAVASPANCSNAITI